MNDANLEKVEAATYRKIIEFLRDAKDVQNIDLMNLAGFCRNCISKWYMASAEEEGIYQGIKVITPHGNWPTLTVVLTDWLSVSITEIWWSNPSVVNRY